METETDSLPTQETGRSFATLSHLAKAGVPWMTLNRLVRSEGIAASITLNGVAYFDADACGMIWEALDKQGVHGGRGADLPLPRYVKVAPSQLAAVPEEQQC